MSARDDFPWQSSVYGQQIWTLNTWREMCDEIDHLRDLAAVTDESRTMWQSRALKAERDRLGLHQFALLIVSLNRTRAIDEVVDATPDDVLRLIDPDMVGPDGWAETRINPDDCTTTPTEAGGQ